MIDTVKLMLAKQYIVMLDKSKFDPDIMNTSRRFFTYVQNPTASELKAGIYKPRLTLANRFNAFGRPEETLTVEFSAPKLLFGNNFEELTDGDFDKVITSLGARLKEMGVYVFDKLLETAPVSSIHYGKNIPLVDYSIPATYIRQLEHVDFNRWLDMSKTDYMNGGIGIKAHSNVHEIAFYDKRMELERAKLSPKRAYEKDNEIQLDLFKEYSVKKPFEVLRMEIRLGRRQKIRKTLADLGIIGTVNFKSVFKSAIAQTVLLSYLKKIEDEYPPLLSYRQNDATSFYTSLLANNPSIRRSTALKFTGARAMLKDLDMRGLRQILGKENKSFWYGFKSEMKSLLPIKEKSTFSLLRSSIEEYSPLRLVDFQDKMLNNVKYS